MQELASLVLIILKGHFPLFSERLFLDTCFTVNYFFDELDQSVFQYLKLLLKPFTGVRLFRCSEKLRKIHRKTPVLGPILWVLPSFWEYLFIEQLHVAASVTSTFLAYDFYFFVQFSPNFVTFSNILPKSINLLSLES